jgi:hypothetical protein
MKKIAVFVEGQTEQIFIEKLLTELIGKKKLVINKFKFKGSMKTQRNPVAIRVHTITNETLYYFTIYDCGCDSSVQTDIRDRITSLVNEGFYLVLGIRDVFPEKNIHKLRQYINYAIPIVDIPVNIIFAVNEIESWFLAEEFHYKKLSNKLTIKIVNDTIGFDIRRETTETIDQPSKMLQKVYNKAQIGYQKRAKQVQKTVKVLSYENLYFTVRKRNNSFNELLTSIESIFEVSTNE